MSACSKPQGRPAGTSYGLSDGKEAKVVVFVQCAGSRDEAKGKPYCSRVCCMYTAKQALLLKDHQPDSQAYVFYIDIRAPRKKLRGVYEKSAAGARRGLYPRPGLKDIRKGRQAGGVRSRHSDRQAGEDRGGSGGACDRHGSAVGRDSARPEAQHSL